MNPLVILGAQESGVGAARLAQQRGLDVFVSDAGAIKPKYRDELLRLGIEFEENGHSAERVLGAGSIVKSPGIPDTASLVVAANERGIPVISEIEFAFRYCKGRIIGITGSNGKYNAVVTTPGLVKIRVSGLKDGKVELINEQGYRVKRIPDPVIRLGTTSSNVITKEYLLAHKSVVAMLTNFDFDAVCNVIGYDLTILPKGGDPVTMTVKGSEIPAQARQIFESLGGDSDAIFFDDIKVVCPGDAAPRNIGGLAFKLKS